MNLPEPVTDPAANYALLVTVESYRFKPSLNLPGLSRSAAGWERWLLDCGVPPSNIFRLRDDSADTQTVRKVIENLRLKSGRLFLMWWGHGCTAADGTRRAVLADFSDQEMSNLNIDSLRQHLRSTEFVYPREQVLIFDFSGEVVDPFGEPPILPDIGFSVGPAAATCRQFVAITSCQSATRSHRENTDESVFSSELRAILSTPAPSAPRDFEHAFRRLHERLQAIGQRETASGPPSSVTLQESVGSHEKSVSGPRTTEEPEVPRGTTTESIPSFPVSPPIPPDGLIAALQNGECIAYVGWGLSVAAGLPLAWREFAERLLHWRINAGGMPSDDADALQAALRQEQNDVVVDSIMISLPPS